MSDPTFPLIPILAFLALLATIAPLGFISFRDHSGIIIFMMWQSTCCIQTMVNTILCHGTADDLAPLWCDISTKIEIARAIGLPASELCLMRGIYRVVRMDSPFYTTAKIRRMILQNLAISVLFPLVTLSFWPFITNRRYIIFENAGCKPHTDHHLIALLASVLWPLLLSVITFVYCVLTLHHCSKMKQNRILAGQLGLNRDVFSRTVSCARMVMFTLPPICTDAFTFFIHSGITPTPGLVEMAKRRKIVSTVYRNGARAPSYRWSDIHHVYVLTVARLSASFCFFSIFGTGHTAVRFYSNIYSRFLSRLGINRKVLRSGSPTVEDDMVSVISHQHRVAVSYFSSRFAARGSMIADSKETRTSAIGVEVGMRPGENLGAPGRRLLPEEAECTPNIQCDPVPC